MKDTVTARPQSLIGPFLAWAAVAAGACVAVLSVLTVGVFVAPLVIAGVIALLWWPRGRTIAMSGMACGAGLVLLYVAYLNRGGPGDVCTPIAGGQACVTEWSPWPWLAAGIVLVALSVAAAALLRLPHGRAIRRFR